MVNASNVGLCFLYRNNKVCWHQHNKFLGRKSVVHTWTNRKGDICDFTIAVLVALVTYILSFNFTPSDRQAHQAIVAVNLLLIHSEKTQRKGIYHFKREKRHLLLPPESKYFLWCEQLKCANMLGKPFLLQAMKKRNLYF